jgi:hypothetical protein
MMPNAAAASLPLPLRAARAEEPAAVVAPAPHSHVAVASAPVAAPATTPALAAAAAAPPATSQPQLPQRTPRFHYRNPATGAVEGPFRLAAFADWRAKGALSADAVAALRVWRHGAPESDSQALADLLAAAAAV